MSARDRYSLDIECAPCCSKGSVNVSENDHAYAPPERQADAVSDGFKIINWGGAKHNVVIGCVKCGAVVFDG